MRILRGEQSYSRSFSSSGSRTRSASPEISENSDSGTSEEEIAAEILQDLKFTKGIPGSRRRAAMASSAAMAATGAKQLASPTAQNQTRRRRRGGQQLTSFDANTVDFQLRGPWEPVGEEEEEEYSDFLQVLVKGNNNVTNWSQARLKKSVAAIFGVLHAAPRGLTRIELRNAARAYVGDTGLLDYTIKVLVNASLCGFFMRRETCEETGKLLYTVDFADAERKRAYDAALSEGGSAEEEDRDGAHHGRHAAAQRRDLGKRKISSPKRFEDFKSSLDFHVSRQVTTAPHVKRVKYTRIPPQVPQVPQCNPLPVKLDDAFVKMQERVNLAQGRLIVGRPQTAAAEVEAIVAQEAAMAPWVNQCLQNEIFKEVTNAHQDTAHLRDQLKQIVQTLC